MNWVSGKPLEPRLTILDEEEVWQQGFLAPVEAEEFDIGLGDVVTLHEHWLSVEAGPVDHQKLALMEEHGYDHAPTSPDLGLQIVSRKTLRELFETGQPLTEAGPFLKDRGIAFEKYFVSVEDLCVALIDRPAAIVFVSAPSADRQGGMLCGLVTHSDLNRKALRQPIFSMLMEIEVRLSELVQARIPHEMDWIVLLEEEAQAKVLGHRELARLSGHDTSAIAATNLSELLRIAMRSKEVLDAMGMQSRTQFQGLVGRIAKLRNKIMHPVRPLVLSEADVAALARALGSMRELLAALRRKPSR